LNPEALKLVVEVSDRLVAYLSANRPSDWYKVCCMQFVEAVHDLNSRYEEGMECLRALNNSLETRTKWRSRKSSWAPGI